MAEDLVTPLAVAAFAPILAGQCLLFEISGQRFAKFAVDLTNASRQLGKASFECFRDVLVLSHA